MTTLHIYTYLLPFLIVAFAAGVVWWTGREHRKHAR